MFKESDGWKANTESEKDVLNQNEEIEQVRGVLPVSPVSICYKDVPC